MGVVVQFVRLEGFSCSRFVCCTERHRKVFPATNAQTKGREGPVAKVSERGRQRNTTISKNRPQN